MKKERSALLSVFCGKRVLVTGHTGFKGSWLSLWLAYLGAKVTGASLDIPTQPSHFQVCSLEERIEDLRLDIRESKSVRDLLREVRPEFVFHLAAQPLVRRAYADPIETWQTNVLGTIYLLEALRTVEIPCVAVLITSDKCYDNVEWVWGYRETDPLGGPDPYSASKGAAEIAIRSYVRSYFPKGGKVRMGIGRAGNVIGGGDWAPDRVVPDCMRAWARGEAVCLRNPRATRPWQYVLEPLSGYLTLAMALCKDPCLHGEPFNFGPPPEQNHSVGELVTLMTEHWKGACWADVATKESEVHESGLLKLNCDKALHCLHWRATWDFQETVKKTAVWYRQYYNQAPRPMAELSIHHIKSYVDSARRIGLPWAF